MSPEYQETVGYLVFKKVRVLNANTISSPITYGFPALTGFLGAFHAMSRTMAQTEALSEYSLGGVLLACHDCQPQVYRPAKYYNYTFNQSRNPIKKDGKTASIIEEGTCHLTMTFVVQVLANEELSDIEKNTLVEQSELWVQQQRITGGSVQALAKIEPVTFLEPENIADAIPLLMPAFVLMDAQAEFKEIIEEVQTENPSATELDALIDVCSLQHIPEVQEDEKIEWQTRSKKTGRGWLVPIPMGYQGISELYAPGVMQHARNPEYSSQYVEAIYGLGKWVYPQRLVDKIKHAFWRYDYQADKQLYLLTQTPFTGE